MLEKDISHNFTDSVRKKFIELGFPSTTSGHLSKIILPFKVDPVEKKVISRCDNFFYLEQIIKPYHEEIHDLVKKCWGDNFIFEIDNTADIQKQSQNTDPISSQKSSPISRHPSQQTISLENKLIQQTQEIDIDDTQFSHFTFKKFIPGQSNIDALNACQYIVKNIGKYFEPVFIYGETGIGKTHLLHAVGNEVFRKNKNVKVIYVAMHDFVNEVIQKGIRLGKMEDVRRKYKFCDLLLVDDIQILEKKSVCQNEFFHIVNVILQRKKQIIIASNKSPKDFKHIDARLKSRFFQGVLVEIHLPTLDDRIEIIKSKSKFLNLNISNEIVLYLAARLKTNVLEIEGAINEVVFKSVTIKNSSISKENIDQLIQKRFQDVSLIKSKKQNLDILQKTVCQHFDIELSVLKSGARLKNVVLARHLAIYLAKEFFQFTNSEIIHGFDRKHHKIVSYAVCKITSLIKTNREIMGLIDTLQKRLRTKI